MTILIRQATLPDLIQMQQVNLFCLPENYSLKYYFYHYLSWSNLLYVAALSDSDAVVGYVLAKMEDEPSGGNASKQERSSKYAEKPHGHITSLAVLKEYRGMGVAKMLMKAALENMKSLHGAHYVSLHVRASNKSALKLYEDGLGFRRHCVEIKYYADNEDAFDMRKDFVAC